MFGIFIESWVIFKQYCGTGFLPVVFLAALLYLLVTEKERYKRIVLVYVPGLVFISFFIMSLINLSMVYQIFLDCLNKMFNI